VADQVVRVSAHIAQANPVVQGMLWALAAGLVLNSLNALVRVVAQGLDPLQTLFLRYLAGLVLMLPLVLNTGLAHYRTRDLRGQFIRCVVHVTGLMMWFTALPQVPLADLTAIGFTTPIFLMLGAAFFLGEKMVLARWVAAGIGFAGVLIVVAPSMTGAGGFYALLMLASSPVFAVSGLLTKTLTRLDSPAVIVFWQALTVTLFSLPLALLNWQPVALWQWMLMAVCGIMGNVGHYCLNRSFAHADLSATQSIKFVDILWASALGFIFFAEVPAKTTLLGAAVILAASLWIARREARTPT
jgi:drug/metabolite transporter (DMT)-like permease